MPLFYAIVPMKAHSERVPQKNIREFSGKPLFYWIFKTLQAVPAIGRIVLDTDAESIADMVLAYFPQVTISMRPLHLHGDLVSTNALIAHVLTLFPEQEAFLQTHATNPGLSAATISRAIAAFAAQSKHDSLFTVTRLQTRLFDAGGRPLNHDPFQLLRTQDLPVWYEENSNLYLFTRSSFRKTGARLGQHPFLFEMARTEAYDIDTEDDFVMAQLLHSKGSTVQHPSD